VKACAIGPRSLLAQHRDADGQRSHCIGGGHAKRPEESRFHRYTALKRAKAISAGAEIGAMIGKMIVRVAAPSAAEDSGVVRRQDDVAATKLT
jgi:hypothetical protein